MTKQTQVRSTEEAPARSALKLALEALNSFPTKHLTPFISSARTAIREALASEASEESSGTEQPAPATELRKQQEPVAVAWMWVVDGKPHNVTFGGANSNTPKDWTVLPLYTSPPASNQCKFPLCQNEDYQQALAEQIKQELYTGEPAQRKPLTDEVEIERLKDLLGKANALCRIRMERIRELEQNQSKPLTVEQIAAITKPHNWLKTCDFCSAYMAGFRDAEAAHGIKENT